MNQVKGVLFVCSHNSARSQMAEGWLRHLAGDRYQVASAGVDPGTLNPQAVEAMAEMGIDISHQKAQGIEDYLGHWRVHTLIVVCDKAAQSCPGIWPGSRERLHWFFDDPAAAQGTHEESMKVFRRVRDEIGRRIQSWIEERTPVHEQVQPAESALAIDHDANNYHFRRADLDDLAGIAHLLKSCGLPIADIQVRPIEFMVVHHRDELAGVVGLEAFNEFGLLRSLAVAHAHRNVSIGMRLVDHACAYAGQTGVKELFLLTTSAEPFFKRLGFQKTDRACVPDAVKRTTEFASLCPETAVCMHKRLASSFRFFSRAALPWRDDASGSAYWSVCLERSMLTYFEAPPDAKFERHSHEAEQITMVLDGELIFECDDRLPVRVKAHEVIAVPSGVPHAVKAGSKGAKAIDAWSPPYAKYATSRASNG